MGITGSTCFCTFVEYIIVVAWWLVSCLIYFTPAGGKVRWGGVGHTGKQKWPATAQYFNQSTQCPVYSSLYTSYSHTNFPRVWFTTKKLKRFPESKPARLSGWFPKLWVPQKARICGLDHLWSSLLPAVVLRVELSNKHKNNTFSITAGDFQVTGHPGISSYSTFPWR